MANIETRIKSTACTGKTLIQDCTITGKACRHYNTKKVQLKIYYIVAMTFAAVTS